MQHRLHFWTAFLLTLALLFSSLLFTACGNGPAPSDDTAGPGDDVPVDPAVFAGKSVRILRANADEGHSAPLASRLTDAGADVRVLTFADLAEESADFSSADLLILDAGDLYYAPAYDVYRAYFESGKPVLSLGDAPLSRPAVLAQGR